MTIKEILMQRDGLTEQEAEDLIQETQEMLLESDPWEADEIMISQLGLEPDYIFELLG